MGAATVLFVAGVAVIIVGILGWAGRLPRNRLVGVRTPATLRSDRAFVAGNRAAGPATVLAGMAGAAFGVVAALSPAPDRTGWILIGALTMAALAVVGAVWGSRTANR